MRKPKHKRSERRATTKGVSKRARRQAVGAQGYTPQAGKGSALAPAHAAKPAPRRRTFLACAQRGKQRGARRARGATRGAGVAAWAALLEYRINRPRGTASTNRPRPDRGAYREGAAAHRGRTPPRMADETYIKAGEKRNANIGYVHR